MVGFVGWLIRRLDGWLVCGFGGLMVWWFSGWLVGGLVILFVG